MSIQNRSTLKGYFNEGDEPSESELENLIDSNVNLDDDSSGLTGNVVITNVDHPMYGETILASTDIVDFIKKVFIPFDPATVSINSTTTYIEKDKSTNISISGTVVNNSETVLNNARITSPSQGTTIHTFIVGDPETPYSFIDVGIDENRTYKTQVDVYNDGNPVTIESALKSVFAVVPYIYGENVTLINNSTIYDSPNMNVVINQAPGSSPSMVIPFSGVLEISHFCYPKSWGLPTEIFDPNNLQQYYGAAGSGEDWEYQDFTLVSPYWTEDMYLFYQGPTTVDGSFTFKF